MKIKAGVNFHNRFDIVKNGEWVGYAENIILDQMYNRICNFSTYFVNIHFGTGSGIPTPDRTSLFSHLGTKTATTEELTKASPISKLTKKITLMPEEYVGQTITEVGVAYGSATNSLVTHAMIKDAEGNPLSLTKSDIDVIEIYATVYIELENPSDGFRFINFPNNSIVNYFLDGTNPSNVIACDRNAEISNTAGPVISQKTGSVVVDVANKKRSISTRFNINEGNGSVKGIRVLNMLKITFPHDGIYTGHNFEGVILGVGDEVTTDFEIPNINPKDIVIKKNDIVTHNYQTLNMSIVEYKLQDLTGVGDNGRGVTISSDGTTIVTASSESPYFTVHKLNEDGTYNKLQNLTGVGNRGFGVTISPDGTTIVTASYDTVPYFTVHKLNEDGTYSKLQDLTGVGSKGYGVTISSDGTTIVASSINAPYFTVHKLNEDGTYSKLQDLTGVGSKGYGVTISSDGTTIVASSINAPYFTVHKLNEDGTYSKLQNLTDVGSKGYGVTISSDGTTIVASSDSSPYFTVHKLNEDGTYNKLQNLTGVGNRGYGVTISPDGTTIVTASYDTVPYFTVHKLNENGTYSKLQDLTDVGNVGYGVTISPDGTTIVTASTIALYFTVHKLSEAIKTIRFDNPPTADDTITADYFVDYIPKTEDYVLDVEFTLQFGEGV